MSWLLIGVAIVVAVVDWFTAKPKDNEPYWPRWVKLGCAVVVAFVGVAGLFEGLVARTTGIEAYKDRDLVRAVENLNTSYSSPFKNRQVIDYLGLTHKNIADQAVDGPVAEASYEKSLEYFLESRVKYPKAPFAKNAMINVYRRTKNWPQLTPLASSFESEIIANYLQNDDGSKLSEKQKAIFLVTLGNVFADQDNPSRSDSKAVALYQMALNYDSNNMFAVLNTPPRLIDMARAEPIHSEKRLKLLEQALELSINGLELDEPRDRVFSVLAILQILMMDSPPDSAGYTISKGLQIVDKYPEAIPDFDIETWFILTEAYLASGNPKKAKESFYQALIYQARFTKEHKVWAKELWAKVGGQESFPFQQLLSEPENHNNSMQPAAKASAD